MEGGELQLENNKAGSLGRLNNLLKNFKQEPDKFKEYDGIIRSQLQEGIVEIAQPVPFCVRNNFARTSV